MEFYFPFPEAQNQNTEKSISLASIKYPHNCFYVFHFLTAALSESHKALEI